MYQRITEKRVEESLSGTPVVLIVGDAGAWKDDGWKPGSQRADLTFSDFAPNFERFARFGGKT
jgi:hypothetical protein